METQEIKLNIQEVRQNKGKTKKSMMRLFVNQKSVEVGEVIVSSFHFEINKGVKLAF